MPQEGANHLPNETALHNNEDDDIEPDVDTSQQSTSLSSPLAYVHTSMTSTVEDVTMPSTAASAAPSQLSISSQLVSSQDSDNEMKDVTSSEEDSLCEDKTSLEECLVVSPSRPPTTMDDDHYSDYNITSQEMMTVSSKPVPSTVECSNVSSTSHTPVTAVTPVDSHTTVELEVAVSNTPSIALSDVTTSLEDDDMDTSTPSSVAAADGIATNVTAKDGGSSSSCRRTPARHAKLNRVPYNDKDENKVTDNMFVP